MAPTDSLMWKLERDPLLRSTVTAIAVFDRAPEWGPLLARVGAVVEAIPRLRERVVEGPGLLPARWVEDGSFDLAYHVRRVAVPAPATLDEVLEMAATWAVAGFDRTRSLWELTLVEGLAAGRAALVQKFHHSITDGVGGIRLALHLYDMEPERGASVLPESGYQTEDPAGGGSQPTPRLPLHIDGLARSTASVIKLMAPSGPPLSPLLTGRGRSWRYAAFERGLAGLRSAAHAAGGTVNDAFVACVLGGLTRYHAEHAVPVQRLRMLMPVSVRGTDDVLWSNRFAPVRLELPMTVADPAERISIVGEASRAWRAEPALRATDAAAAVLDLLPAPAAAGMFGMLLKSVDFVTTDVAGFPFPVFLGGAQVLSYYAFAPTMGAALNVALLSHEARACVGITADAAAVPDVDVLRRCIEDATDEVIASGRSSHVSRRTA